MKNIHILKTDQPSRLIFNPSHKSFCIQKELNGMYINDGKVSGADFWGLEKALNNGFRPQHIYITSDEKIKEGDWFMSDFNSFPIHNIKELSERKDSLGWKQEDLKYNLKIILTTDQDLIKDGVQAIDDEFLEWYVKNSSCESVGIYFPLVSGSFKYKIIIPQEEPKYVSSGGAKYIFGTVKGEYTIGNPSPNTAKGEFTLAMGYNPETTNKPEGHHSIVIGNGLTSTKPYQLLVDRNGVKIDTIMTIEEYELLHQVLKSINDIIKI
jgi:hypothetical protein